MKQQLDLFGQAHKEDKKTEVVKEKQVIQKPKIDNNFTCKPQPYTFYRETPTITWVWNKNT